MNKKAEDIGIGGALLIIALLVAFAYFNSNHFDWIILILLMITFVIIYFIGNYIDKKLDDSK
jgi:uncharacterized membrane protein YfcA